MPSGQVEQRAHVLSTPEEVDAFLAQHPDCVLFKAGSCHRTDNALENLEAILGARTDIPVGLIRVVEARSASQRVAERTSVRHASPQVILIHAGRVVHARDNWDISRQAIEQALAEHFTA